MKTTEGGVGYDLADLEEALLEVREGIYPGATPGIFNQKPVDNLELQRSFTARSENARAKSSPDVQSTSSAKPTASPEAQNQLVLKLKLASCSKLLDISPH